MAFELPPLPFEYDALESKGMSKETLEYHHGKHHPTYVKTLNDLVAGTENEGKSLEEVIKGAEGGPLFNNAGAALEPHVLLELPVAQRRRRRPAARSVTPSARPSARTTSSPRSSPRRRRRSSARAGRGSSTTAASRS